MTVRGGPARVFTIPAGASFLPTLADALLDGALTDGWPVGASLADATVYLPTRRACRAFAAVLAERGPARATLLPRIIPLGEQESDPVGWAAAPDVPPPLTGLERRLILARLIAAWAARQAEGTELAGSPAEAILLASDLEALMDALATESIPWDALQGVVETEFSAHFGSTLQFLRIAHENWPAILRERRASDPARHRDEALRAEADRLGGTAS
ncbi:MAG: double-strand break repair protein AddB, partial [Enterovirga sp.]|nr:double-strand break repair protein AddB [Enterovirga sp.]